MASADNRAVNTHGVKLGFAVGNTVPSSFERIYDVKALPELGSEPNTLESTTLLETEYTQYVEGLNDLGGALEITANMTDKLIEQWESVMSAYDGMTADQNMYWVFSNPNLSKASVFTGKPSNIQYGASEVDAVFEATLYITPDSAPQFINTPTFTEHKSA